MAISTETEADSKKQGSTTQTAPERFGGWLRRLGRRVRLGMGGEEEEVVVENATEIAWLLYQDFHEVGTIWPNEIQTFKLFKRGSLSARPVRSQNAVEYLVLPLSRHIQRIRIYRRQMAQELEVYDMQAA